MLNLTQEAINELNTFFEGKEKQSIRIYLAPGGWRGPRLAMALDEPEGDDTVIEEAGFKFCINKDLLEEATGINVNVSYMGFEIEPVKPFANAGGGCGSSCGSGGCGTDESSSSGGCGCS